MPIKNASQKPLELITNRELNKIVFYSQGHDLIGKMPSQTTSVRPKVIALFCELIQN